MADNILIGLDNLKNLMYNVFEYYKFYIRWLLTMEKNKIRLNICGTDYSITTEDDPKYVMALGDELDSYLTKTLRENNRISVTQAAILAALEYADMYKKAEISADNLRSQIKEYLEDSARSKMDAEIAKREVERLTRELQNVQAKLG